MITGFLLPLFLAVLGSPAPQPELRLVAESLEGEALVLGFADLPLEDPRTVGAYIVRPEGFPRDQRPAKEGLASFELVNGDVMRGRIAQGEGDILELEVQGGVMLKLSIEEIRSYTVPSLFPDRLDEPLTSPDEGDRLFRMTGSSLDRIDGTVEEFTLEGVRFDSVLGSKVFPWNEIAALFVEVLEEAGAERDPADVPIVLDLVDGTRLRGRLEELDVQGARIFVGASQSSVLVAWEHVEELFLDDGSLSYLSSLAPVQEEGNGTPFDDDFGMSWPHQIDRSVLGDPLRAGGRSFGRGVGVHAPSVLRWELDPRWDELRGAVAIDDSAMHNAAGARGSVIFRIRLDGEILWESPLVRGGEPPRQLPTLKIPVSNKVRVLELEVDPVEDFRGDRADWIRLLLLNRP